MGTEALKSPAIAFVGRHNSGKTTLVVSVIEELVARGVDVGSVKHHGHVGFEVDVPGKDSWRHRRAGANEVVVCSPDLLALIRELEDEVDAAEAVNMMRPHDVVIVEGYRSCGLPSVEIMRAANERDAIAAEEFMAMARRDVPFSYDRAKLGRDADRMPDAATVAVASDIEQVRAAATALGIAAFTLDDAAGLADLVQERFVRR